MLSGSHAEHANNTSARIHIQQHNTQAFIGGLMSRFRSILFFLVLHALQFSSPTSALPRADSDVGKGGAQRTSEQIWATLESGNQRFVSGKAHPHNHTEQRQSLVNAQQPEVAVLSCADSRVPPEILFDQGLGALFVVRSAGNSADAMGVGSLEYAVEHLGSKVIVVLGHQSCGAVKAACSGDKMPSANLDAVVQPVLPSCKATANKGDALDFAVRDHVHRTSKSLLTESAILKHAADEGKLTIIEAYYELDSGRIVRLH
jgi:carbonic anhydrase